MSIARLPTLEEINAHYWELEKRAYGYGVAKVRKAKVHAVARLLENEVAEARQNAMRERLGR